MARRPEVVLLEMISSIDYATEAVGQLSYEKFEKDQTLRLAAQRALEIISEASRHIPEPLRDTETEISWIDIRSIGNRIRHEYHHISDELVFQIINEDLDDLRAALARMLTRL